MRISTFFVTGIGVSFYLAFHEPILAAIWHVDGSVAESGDGTSWGTAFRGVQEGIQRAGKGDTVIVGEGVYREAINFLGKAIVLESRNPEDPAMVAATVLDGSGPGSPVVSFNSREGSDSAIAGFTITGGDTSTGGGVYCWQASPTIRNNVIRRSKAADVGGGACLSVESWAILTHNEVIENTTRAGGGVWCSGSSPVIERNRICANHAEDGAGVYSGRGAAMVIGNLIQGNSAERYGRGMVVGWRAEDPTVRSNVIVANIAGYSGGAVFVDDAQATLTNNTIVGNRAQFVGGVRSNSGGSAWLVDCIL